MIVEWQMLWCWNPLTVFTQNADNFTVVCATCIWWKSIYLHIFIFNQSPSHYLEKWKFQIMETTAHMPVHFFLNRKGLKDYNLSRSFCQIHWLLDTIVVVRNPPSLSSSKTSVVFLCLVMILIHWRLKCEKMLNIIH